MERSGIPGLSRNMFYEPDFATADVLCGFLSAG
jgi:hypothetical protein